MIAYTKLVCEFDLFMVTETRLDPTEPVNIDEYDLICKPRQRPYIRRSDDFGIFLKRNLSRYAEMLQSESEYVLWDVYAKRAAYCI